MGEEREEGMREEEGGRRKEQEWGEWMNEEKRREGIGKRHRSEGKKGRNEIGRGKWEGEKRHRAYLSFYLYLAIRSYSIIITFSRCCFLFTFP